MAKNTNKIIAGVVGVVGIYFIVKYFMGKKVAPVKAEEPVKPADILTPTATDSFPLKKGSSGARVTQIQSLILKIDKKLLPKFGADGKYGTETETGVSKLLGKKTVDSQSDVDKLNQIYQRKAFPYVTPNPQSPETKFPIYKQPF